MSAATVPAKPSAKAPLQAAPVVPAGRGSRFLFNAALMVAVGLLAMVVASPYMLTAGEESPDLLLLFARDMTVRRTAFFCAVGMTATAFIFFRPELLKKKKETAAASGE